MKAGTCFGRLASLPLCGLLAGEYIGFSWAEIYAFMIIIYFAIEQKCFSHVCTLNQHILALFVGMSIPFCASESRDISSVSKMHLLYTLLRMATI